MKTKISAHHPLRIVKCIDCGKDFETCGPGERCAECFKAHRKAYFRNYVRPSRRKSLREEAQQKIEEAARCIEAQKAAAAKIGDAPKHRAKPVLLGVCCFCGRPCRESAKFCASCIRDGFDAVYELTGKTNGWDRKVRTVAKIAGVGDSWRGCKVAGGAFVTPTISQIMAR